MSNEGTPFKINTYVIPWHSRWQRAIQEEFQRLEEQNVFSLAPFSNNTLPTHRFHFVPRNPYGTKARLVLWNEKDFQEHARFQRRLRRYRRAKYFLEQAQNIVASCDKKSLTYRTILAWALKTIKLIEENPHINFWKLFSNLSHHW